MVQTVGSVPCERFDDLVDQSVKLVRVMTGCQFALGDFALEIAPLRTHGGNMSLGEGEEQGVEDSLRLFAEEIGLSFHTVRTYRWVAARWPKDQRQEGVSFEVHRILASAPDAYELIQHPPVNERTGRSEWSGDAAKRAAGWATATPVTAAEKVEAIRDLAQDDAVAAQAACALLYRPEVAFKAMRPRLRAAHLPQRGPHQLDLHHPHGPPSHPPSPTTAHHATPRRTGESGRQAQTHTHPHAATDDPTGPHRLALIPDISCGTRPTADHRLTPPLPPRRRSRHGGHAVHAAPG